MVTWPICTMWVKCWVFFFFWLRPQSFHMVNNLINLLQVFFFFIFVLFFTISHAKKWWWKRRNKTTKTSTNSNNYFEEVFPTFLLFKFSTQNQLKPQGHFNKRNKTRQQQMSTKKKKRNQKFLKTIFSVQIKK